VLLLDEYTDGKPDTLAAINQLVLEGKLGDYVFPDETSNPDHHWRIIGTGNRAVDKAHAQKISRAASNRWNILNICIDVDAWIEWAIGAGIDAALVAYVQTTVIALKGMKDRDVSEAIHQYPASGSDAVAFKTPRSLARCDRYLKMPVVPADAQLRRLFSQNIGDNAAHDLMTFLASYRLAPSITDILKDPAGYAVPREPSVNFAISVGLVSRLTLTNVATVNKFVARMGANYQAAFWNNALAKDKAFEKTPEHVEYLIATRDEDRDAA
jgi:hypothetical protein